MHMEKRYFNGTVYYRARYSRCVGKWYTYQGFCSEWNQTDEWLGQIVT